MSEPEEPREKLQPHYDLNLVRRAFRDDEFHLPQRVQRHLIDQGWTRQTCMRIGAQLEPQYFHKSQAHWTREGVWLDIYRPVVEGVRWYVKVVVREDGVGFVVLSFCLDGARH